MSLDYFRILEISKAATDPEINKAYRKLAIKYHPDQHPENLTFCQKKFAEIAEAFEVLTNPKLRAAYNHYGSEELKKGTVPSTMGVDRYIPTQPKIIFEQFFGTANPNEISLYPETEQFVLAAQHPQPQQAQPITVTLPVTLEELYIGCTKIVKYTRLQAHKPSQPIQHSQSSQSTKFTQSSHSSHSTDSLQSTQSLTEFEANVSVEVKCGYENNTTLTYCGIGNESVDGKGKQGNVVVIICQKEHKTFIRRKNDLVYKSVLTLEQALVGCTVALTSLDGRELHIPIADVVRPGYRKIVTGEGMPILGTKEMGNLIIEFEVEFPERLLDVQKKLISAALSGNPAQWQSAFAMERNVSDSNTVSDSSSYITETTYTTYTTAT